MPVALANSISQFTREVRTAFLDLYEQTEKRLMAKLAEGEVFETVPSDRDSEDYPHWRATPQLVEYDEGNLQLKTFGSDTYSVKNRLFGVGITVPLSVFEDMNGNPTAKLAWQQRIAGLAQRAVNFRHKQMADLLLGEGLYTSETGWDAEALCATSHAEGSNLINAAAGAATTFALSDIETEHDLVMDAFAAMTDTDNEDILREEVPDRLTVLVDPQHLRTYASFFRAQFIPQFSGTTDVAGAAMANVMSPAADNVMRGIDGLGRQVTLIGWSRLRNKSKTFYFDSSRQIPGPAPILHQQRLRPQLDTLGVNSERAIQTENLLFKVRVREAMAVGDFCKTVQVLKTGS